MQIFLVSNRGKKTASVSLRNPSAFILLVMTLAVLGGGLFFAGMKYGVGAADKESLDENRILSARLEYQKRKISTMRGKFEKEGDALALRVAQLHSQVLRLNAVGQRVVEKARLDPVEFDFSELPPQGGIDISSDARVRDTGFLKDDVILLASQLVNQEMQLSALETLLTAETWEKETFPAGRPVEKGWISSNYGWRTNPFSGRRAFHGGVDIAAKWGAETIAVASGVVVHAGLNGGYGYLVEINHGDGYVTRYAHNEEILVKQGDTVNQGQVIARVGSTGFSTGPHVHFEVLRKGKTINPVKYMRASR